MKTSHMSGAVLVGGRSARMGRTKARLKVDGQPLWQRQRSLLAASGAHPVVLVLRPRQRSFGAGAIEVRDLETGAGPLAGVAAALAGATDGFVAVLAVDLPAMEAEWFQHLWRRCRAGRGAMFRSARGYEPLAAIYPAAAAPVAVRRLGAGKLRLQELARDLERRRLLTVLPLPPRLAPMAANWNRPGDWAAIRPPQEPSSRPPRR